jgi:hypothetical protein
MMRARSSLFGLILGGAVLFTATAARADGLAIGSADLPEAARKTLVKDVAAFKAAHPEAFDRVRDIQGIRPEFYKQARRPDPLATVELKRLGKDALLPMLNALALETPAITLSDKEKTAYLVGLLEASSALHDARGGAVYTAVFESKNKPAEVLRAAARAMGRLCSDTELASLKKHTATGDALRAHAIDGLGECMRKESAEHLATMLASAEGAAAADPIATALGRVGSSWAWKALGTKQEANARVVQATAAKALVNAFVKHKDARTSAEKALRMVEAPDATVLISSVRDKADADTRTALDKLAKALAPKVQR